MFFIIDFFELIMRLLGKLLNSSLFDEKYNLFYMNRIIYLLVGLLFIACVGRKSQQNVEPFPVMKSLHAEKVEVDEIFNLSMIMWKEKYLFVSDIRSNDTMIYQYSLPEFKCIYRGGSKGQSGDEFQIFPVFCRTTTNIMYIWGYTPSTIKSFTIDDIGRLSMEKEYKLPTYTDMYNDMHVVRDSILIVKDIVQLAIRKINLNNQEVMGEILFKKDKHNETFFSENSGYMIANDSLIIYAYKYKKQIDFYGIDDMKLKKRLLGNDAMPQIVLYDLENSVQYCYGLLAGKDCFYVRCPVKENGKENVEVYDYSGHSIAKYELDNMLGAFAVDELNRVIYGYNSEVCEDVFLKYVF